MGNERFYCLVPDGHHLESSDKEIEHALQPFT